MTAMNDYQNLQNLTLSEANKYLVRLMTRCLLEGGMSIGAVSFHVNRHPQTVRRWEARDDIHDLPRAGHPPIYGEAHQLKAIGFYCQTQPLPGCGRWSLRMAAAHLNANPEQTGFSMSKSTIFRILQSHNLKPHRRKYFLHISDPYFFPRMEHIIALYLNPPPNLFCFDECPGIQVLRRLAPDQRTEETKVRLEEFEYIRNGTIDLLACLEVATGKVFAECHPGHDSETLSGFMEKHFLSIPENEPIHYILDNLNTHCSYEICALVAKHSNVECPPKKELDTMEKRRGWLTGTEKRIVFHFTPLHGSWLNMIEIWFGIIGAKCLNESFVNPVEMHDAIMTFVNELWNNLMAHPFNWSYDGEGLHEKVVQRFIRNLEPDGVRNMDLRFLTKQLLLMENLFHQYHNKVSEKYWDDLTSSLQNKISDLREKIENEPGPKRKKQAIIALKELECTLIKGRKIAEEHVA